MNESRTDALTIRDLSYSYRGNWSWKRQPAVGNLNLEVSQGEAFGFLGHNGAGKTTTIKCILGLLKPQSGDIRIFGTSTLKTESRRLVGYLPEQPYFYDHLSVREIVSLYASLSDIERPKIKAAVSEALERTGLAARSSSPLRALSKGFVQRVALAQAIVARPRLLLLDEPFSGLDPVARKEFRDLLSELKRGGTTIFMSSHILSDVEFFCERASIMLRGRLQGIYTIREIPALLGSRYEIIIKDPGPAIAQLAPLSSENVMRGDFVRLVFADQDKARMALGKALEAGLSVESYQPLHGGLEELFLKAVQTDKLSEKRNA